MIGLTTRSLSLATLALTLAFGYVNAYAPAGRLPSPSFLTLPCQQQCGVPGTSSRMAFRRRPILFASDPETPIQETTESSSKTSETETTSTKNNDAPSLPDIDLPFDVSGLAFKVALGLVAAFATYELATIAIATTTEFLTTLSSSFQNNFWGFLASLPENLWNLAVGIFGFLKVFLPAVGEFGKSAYDVAAPIVSETSQKAMEVAAPVLQDTAEKVAPLLEEASRTANEAAAPYVDQLQTAVESSIVAPIQDAKGAVETQVQETTQAVSGAVEAQVSSATKAVGDAVDAQIQGTSKAVETQIQSASKNVGDALDAQFKKFFP